MSELKPCPFCGADNGYVDVIPNPFSNDIYSRGHCIKCHAVGAFYVQSYLEGELRPSFEQMAQMATEKWNTRPIEDELRKRIAELEAAQRWIPVSERLPEVGKVVHVIDMNEIGSHLCNLYETAVLVEESGNKIFGFIGNSGWDTSDVTHWMYAMPLPEPPIVYGKVCEE